VASEIRDIFARVDAGEPMPSGQCPECGCLTHLAALRPAPSWAEHWTLEECAECLSGLNQDTYEQLWDRVSGQRAMLTNHWAYLTTGQQDELERAFNRNTI